MTSVDQREQPGQTISQDFDQSGAESIKIERNSKGVNFSYRVVRHEGQTWEDVLEIMDSLHFALTSRYGQ